VFYSTQFVFRVAGVLPSSDHDYNPFDFYGESKVQSEILIKNSLPSEQFLILRPTYIWGPGLDRFRDGLLYRLLRGQLIISNDPQVKRYYGYVETIAGQTLDLARLSFAELPHKVYYISDDAINLSEFCFHFISALGKGKVWSAPAKLIRGLGALGGVISWAGLRPPISPVQARELTTNFPVPIEPTLKLTKWITDLPSAAAKMVAWARTDKRFASAIAKTA
jgi:nucleoside-diphosphate-sugar epimerase